MEHWHLYHHPVCRGQIHAVADTFAIIDDIAVSEHHAFGESGSAGGVLHVADVIRTHHQRATMDLLHRDALGKGQGLLPTEAAGLGRGTVDDMPQEWQTLAVQRLHRIGCFQFGAQFRHYAAVIAVSIAVDHDQRMRI